MSKKGWAPKIFAHHVDSFGPRRGKAAGAKRPTPNAIFVSVSVTSVENFATDRENGEIPTFKMRGQQRLSDTSNENGRRRR